MYNVSVSPHIRDKSNTTKIMLDVCIALAPTLIFGVCYFGLNALVVIISSVVSCVLSEAVFELITKKPITVGDLSAVVTGLILALNMPPEIAWWVPFIGGVFAIIIVKMLFGGIGQNIMNPALAARCFLLISFASRMTNFTTCHTVDASSSATPLAVIKAGGSVNVLDMFIGFQDGCIGEVSALCIFIGFVYLLARKVISPRIPVVVVASSMLFIALFSIGKSVLSVNYMLSQLFTGGVLSGAVFMANDYATSPITKRGQYIYSVIIGLLIACFRVLGSSAEGVSYAIITSNLLVPLIEKITVPKPFGMKKKEEV